MRKVIAIVADDHAGSPVALPPAPTWDFVDGGPHEFCDWQITLWNHWLDCWAHVADLRKGAQLIVIHAGDATEGVHHGTVQLLTQRIDEQERMHVSAMRAGLSRAKFNRKRDHLLYLTGTPAHMSQGNTSTERIARALLNTEELDGSVLQHCFYKTVNGVLFDVAHAGYKLSSRRWLRTNGIRAYLMDRYIHALEDRQPVPRYIVRAHRHTFGHDTLEDKQRHVVSEGFLMPCWKMPDEYTATFDAKAVGNIGMLVFVIEDNGTCQDYPLLMTCDPHPVDEL